MSKTLVLNRKRNAFRVVPDRRVWSQAPGAVSPHDDWRCCVKGCRRRIALAGDGWAFPVCVAHAALLGPKLFDAVTEAAAGSPFNPGAVLECTLLVEKILARCVPVARRGKAKRKP